MIIWIIDINLLKRYKLVNKEEKSHKPNESKRVSYSCFTVGNGLFANQYKFKITIYTTVVIMGEVVKK